MEQFSVAGDGLLVRAPAKINLTLLVAGKRPDGFHELETIMARIDLYDELLFEPGSGSGIELVCGGKYNVSPDSDNLVYRAWALLSEHIGYGIDVRITLTKNIPIGAGLGGGSSDAAATLMGLNKFAKLGIDNQTLHELASQLGSDINFFLGPPTALCTGRGEKIKEISGDFNFQALLILPDVNVSTKRVYENYSHDRALFQVLKTRVNELVAKKKVDLTGQMCLNMLQVDCFGLHKQLAALKLWAESLSGVGFCLSGSGSAMYGITDCSRTEAERIRSMLESSTVCDLCDVLIVNRNRW